MTAAPEKTTALHAWHAAQGANLALFGGYEMPLWYPAGVRTEHLSVLTHAGLFDTSHMAAITLGGTGAFDLLQHCFSKDLRACIGKHPGPLSPGRSVYGVFFNARGEVVDDAIVSHLEDGTYFVVVNAGMGAEVARHLETYADAREVSIVDLTDQLGKMDLQGPLAANILSRVLADADRLFSRFPYFSFKGRYDSGVPCSEKAVFTDGTPVLLSRTGYTGEFGFELFVAREHTVRVWQMLLDTGTPIGMVSCGLAARDSLRTGAVLPLSHQDIGAWPFGDTPWMFVLPYTEDHSGFSKSFVGDQALLSAKNVQRTCAFVGFDPRKITTGEAAVYRAQGDDTPIGSVLTCATDMALGRYDDRIYSVASPDRPGDFRPRGLSCGFIKVSEPLSEGQRVILRDARREIQVVVTTDIRPDRTARRPITEMLSSKEESR